MPDEAESAASFVLAFLSPSSFDEQNILIVPALCHLPLNTLFMVACIIIERRACIFSVFRASIAMAASTALSSALFFSFFFVLPLQGASATIMPPAVRLLQKYERIQLKSVTGPESLAFDADGGGPYTGISDGRVLKWESASRMWVEFAVPMPNRNGTRCDGSAVPENEDKCGRPLGLQFHRATGNLYIADAYYGLMIVGSGGGVAAPLVVAAEGKPFFLTNGVDVDQESGIVYFTDSSTQFRRRDWIMAIVSEDATGRFIRYDPRTRQTEVLQRDLQFPNGVAISEDGRFAIVAETTRRRLLRYWLKGSSAGKLEVFAHLPGFPDNVKRNMNGEFRVGIQSPYENVIGVKLDAAGRITEILRDQTSSGTVSELLENNGTLWLGSVERPFVGIYSL